LAAGPTTTIDFEGILAANEPSHIFPGGFTISGVNFVDINPSFIGQTQTSFIEVADGMNLGAGTDVVYSLNDNTDSVFTTQITLPLGGVLAFGTDIKFNEVTGGGTFMVQLFSGSDPLGPAFVTEPPFTPADFNQFGFIGFTSDTPITSVQIGKFTGVASSANVVLDNTSFGAPVPEPVTYVSLILGASLLLIATRKRRA
jgi:hypothetical protein